jgi:hypothetical protein
VAADGAAEAPVQAPRPEPVRDASSEEEESVYVR